MRYGKASKAVFARVNVGNSHIDYRDFLRGGGDYTQPSCGVCPGGRHAAGGGAHGAFEKRILYCINAVNSGKYQRAVFPTVI